MRIFAALAAALLLAACTARAPAEAGEAFALRPFTATGTLTWQRETYTAAVCRGADGAVTVSLQNGRLAEPVVFFADAGAQGMRLGSLSLELPARGGAPQNVALRLRDALASLEGVRLSDGAWRGEGCALSCGEGAWKTLELPEGTLEISSISFSGTGTSGAS